MALQISEVSGVFSVFGELNSYNSTILKRHMSTYIKKDERVILNLERVKKMDFNAAYTIKQIFIDAVRKNSIFSIVAMENKQVMDVFKETQIPHIVSNDRY